MGYLLRPIYGGDRMYGESQLEVALIIIQANILWSTVSIFENIDSSSASLFLMRERFCVI